jgi:hypothetical protein
MTLPLGRLFKFEKFRTTEGNIVLSHAMQCNRQGRVHLSKFEFDAQKLIKLFEIAFRRISWVQEK